MKPRGEEVSISTVFISPFGECLLGVTERGICISALCSGVTASLRELREQWPRSFCGKMKPDREAGGRLPVANSSYS